MAINVKIVLPPFCKHNCIRMLLQSAVIFGPIDARQHELRCIHQMACMEWQAQVGELTKRKIDQKLIDLKN